MSPAKRRHPADSKDEERVLTDPQAIRALAHPARLAVLEELAQGHELTATDCAAVAGLSASAMSYHLRALEKWGFVERAPASEDGRERPWRATASRWRIDEMSTQATATAADTVLGTMLERLRKAFAEWFDHERDQPKEWRDAGVVNNATLWLTADEAAALIAQMTTLLDGFRTRTAADHPDGARRVRIAEMVVPLEFE